MPIAPMLKGLFDRPISNPIGFVSNPNAVAPVLRPADDAPFNPGNYGCDDPYIMDASGFCVLPPESYAGPFTGTGLPYPITTGDSGSQPITTTGSSAPIDVTIYTTNNITDQVGAALTDAVNEGISEAAKNAQEVADAAANKIASAVTEETDAITEGIAAASTNLGTEVTITTAALAASTAATVGTIGSSVGGLVDDLKKTLTPILQTIGSTIDAINKQVQLINDTLIQPIANLINGTIGTVVNLTTAIEADLKDGIGGLLKIPGQLADQLGSFDALLNRTIEQLGIANKEIITDSIKFAGTELPTPFSAAFGSALGGATLTHSVNTTPTDKVSLSSESLSSISSQAISAIGTLLKETMQVYLDAAHQTYDDQHGILKEAGGIFVNLLDGLMGVLTTITAIGAVAGPLLEAAEEEARTLVPTKKLDPATVLSAITRGILTRADGLKEIARQGYDTTRQQTLIDLSAYLVDTNQALDWWYRGIISHDDLSANLDAHGFTLPDKIAYEKGSTNLPALIDLQRWLNFGLLTQDEFISNARILRYDDAQITAVLTTYQARETPDALARLQGLLDNSNAGWVRQTLLQDVPASVQQSGQRAGYHPDLVRYIWLAHWQLPAVSTFITEYFRGRRTLTEVQERMAVDNIPSELWDDVIDSFRPLIQYRSLAGYVKAGIITVDRATQELARHGYDLERQNIIAKTFVPPVSKTAAAAAPAVHTLSLGASKTLWDEGALTDDQYKTLLVAHGYTDDLAAAQLAADKIAQHIKQQRQFLSDLTAEVQVGVTTLDDAISQLHLQGFSSAQVASFQNKIIKQQKSNIKHPSLPELDKFLKAQLITLDQYKSELQVQGWTDPWLTAFLGLVSANGVAATSEAGQ